MFPRWWDVAPDPGYRVVGRCRVCGGPIVQMTTWTATFTNASPPPPQCGWCRQVGFHVPQVAS